MCNSVRCKITHFPTSRTTASHCITPSLSIDCVWTFLKKASHRLKCRFAHRHFEMDLTCAPPFAVKHAVGQVLDVERDRFGYSLAHFFVVSCPLAPRIECSLPTLL